MSPPALGLSLALVLLACRPARPRPEPGRGRPVGVGATAATTALACLPWLAVGLGAKQVADALSVTPPTVRLAAGVAVAVTALADVVHPRRSLLDEAATPLHQRLAIALDGTGRVELGVAVWSLGGDHGRWPVLLAVGCLVPIGTAATTIGEGPFAALWRNAAAVGALVSGVLVAVAGVLGL